MNADAINGLAGIILMFAMLFVALRMILGPAFRWVFPLVLLGLFVQLFPNDPTARVLWTIVMQLAGPFIVLGLLYSVLVRPMLGGHGHDRRRNGGERGR